jgi:hypothetical protein
MLNNKASIDHRYFYSISKIGQKLFLLVVTCVDDCMLFLLLAIDMEFSRACSINIQYKYNIPVE